MLYSGEGHLELIYPPSPAAAFGKCREVCSFPSIPFILKTVLEQRLLCRGKVSTIIWRWSWDVAVSSRPWALFLSAQGESCSLGRNTGDRELDPQKPHRDVGIPRGKEDGSGKQLLRTQLVLRSAHIFNLARQLLLPYQGGGFLSCLFPSFLSLPHKVVSSFINQHLCVWHTLAGKGVAQGYSQEQTFPYSSGH